MTDVIPISCYLNFHLRVKDKMWRSFASSVERKEMKERPKNRPKIRCRQFPCSWTFSECPFPLPPSTHYYYHSLSALLCLSDCESASGCEIAGVYMGCSKRTAKERPPRIGSVSVSVAGASMNKVIQKALGRLYLTRGHENLNCLEAALQSGRGSDTWR